MVRLGGPIPNTWQTPGEWVAAVRRLGYGTARVPVQPGADHATVRAYEDAARDADIVIAEIGAWSNPMSPDPQTRREALHKCKAALALADEIGARCCVNIAGSRSERWDGPAPENLSDSTFEMVVEQTRDIIDTVKPTRTFYTLETMPWVFPDSVDSYLDLIRAIDRDRFGVHFDPVNIISSPQLFFRNSDLLRDGIRRLGPCLRCCHAKDIALSPKLTVHLDEVRPGLGGLDYATFLRELHALPEDVPLLLEHLPNQDEYRLAADHIRSVAADAQIPLI